MFEGVICTAWPVHVFCGQHGWQERYGDLWSFASYLQEVCVTYGWVRCSALEVFHSFASSFARSVCLLRGVKNVLSGLREKPRTRPVAIAAVWILGSLVAWLEV